MKLSIIIPVYNEEKTVEEILKRVLAVKLPLKIEKEIIVVDDGSSDNTPVIINKFTGVKKIFHQNNLGKGSAIKTGLKVATGEVIVIQDGDLEYDPLYYPLLLKPILDKKADVVYGTRLINYPLRLWGENKTILPLHLVANRFLTVLTNILYGSNLTDMETCYKVFRRSCISGVELISSGFAFEPEITAKFLKKGLKIIEVPIKVKPRTHKEGKKISWFDGLEAVFTLFRYRL